MKEVAFGALGLALVGALAMIFAAVFSNSAYNIDCTDEEYLDDKYGENSNDKEVLCEEDVAAKKRLSRLIEDIGYPLLLFSLVLMIGANRLQDT